ncbi:bifunctional diguanylate cyclase/phosphodiesterase [Pseudooctadecabacter jejudonensis]|uniref:Phytochrome-like protein cph2 n=1 Tax=Pseudooctadecabacter jejudonensis TaxID=1391910 RepID=A0A1Y5S1U9_9RHOB|nr:bifunctional diguanylate cyclase/phosphodiesterase [Pseudooctadecabacter jejudonensis]SLN27796.1 Phytochrome-like protein cph2 [Pseudooctadecabacter jejudonensis]
MTKPNAKIARRQGWIIGAAGCGFSLGAILIVLGPAGILTVLMLLPAIGAVSLARRRLSQSRQQTLTTREVVTARLSLSLGVIEYPTTALLVEIDDHHRLEEVYGRDVVERAIEMTRSVIEENLTDSDLTVHLDGALFASVLAPQGPLDTETMLNTCTRIQHALGLLSQTSDLPLHLTASIGFVTSNKLARPTAESLMQAAFSALSEARRRAPGAVRAYSEAISAKRAAQQRVARDARQAFEKGEIFAYFQPQLNVETGQLSGFEALTRWHHPVNGILSPAEFLPTFEQAGLMPRLGETMIKKSLQALTFWDKSGLDVPRIGINFSTSELSNPRLVEQIAMYLDVSNISPERLNIEVLETVIAQEADDIIIGNLAALADLGCGVDLDDFGTGYASITNIRRFSVGRIKIDRSFVSGIDSDDEQRRMVEAILTMASRLGVRTLAEGVETRAERETLTQMACDDIQGFQIARPMPVEETVEWANAYFTRTLEPITISRRAS